MTSEASALNTSVEQPFGDEPLSDMSKSSVNNLPNVAIVQSNSSGGSLTESPHNLNSVDR